MIPPLSDATILCCTWWDARLDFTRQQAGFAKAFDTKGATKGGDLRLKAKPGLHRINRTFQRKRYSLPHTQLTSPRCLTVGVLGRRVLAAGSYPWRQDPPRIGAIDHLLSDAFDKLDQKNATAVLTRPNCRWTRRTRTDTTTRSQLLVFQFPASSRGRRTGFGDLGKTISEGNG